MSDVINRTTVQLLRSVNTPDYSDSEWIINPNLYDVEGVPQKYWKISGDSVLEMTAEEKAAYDAAHPIITADTLRDARLTRYTVGGDRSNRWTGFGTSWATARTFRFVGSGKAGVPKSFRAIVGVNGAYTGNIRLRDLSGNNTTALISGFTGENGVVEDTHLVNVPVDAAEMAVQMSGSDFAAEVCLYFFELVFD